MLIGHISDDTRSVGEGLGEEAIMELAFRQLTKPKVPKSTKPGAPSFRKPNLIPSVRERNRLRVKVAQKEQNSCTEKHAIKMWQTS